jgi:hypothetical protein
MGIRRTLRTGLVITGAASAAAMAVKRANARRSARRFYAPPKERLDPVDLGAFHGGSPVVWHKSESYQTLHSASFEAAAAALPTSELHPVRFPGGRAVVLVASFQHDVITAHGVRGRAMLPYGEVLVAVLVTRRPARPLLPLVAPSIAGFGAGAFVLHLPVTTKAARDAGRLLFGYPKFTADMEFEDAIETCRVRLDEGGRHILSQTIRPAGPTSVMNAPLTLYSALDGELIAETMPLVGLQQRRPGRRGGYLELGDHQIADELRSLDISSEPFLTTRVSALRFAMTPGRPIGSARQYLGYIGDERELGRYMVSYPNAAPIDQYAPFAPTAGAGRTFSEASSRTRPEPASVMG